MKSPASSLTTQPSPASYGVVSAVGVFYLVPSLVLYAAAQRYLMQMSVGGVKG